MKNYWLTTLSIFTWILFFYSCSKSDDLIFNDKEEIPEEIGESPEEKGLKIQEFLNSVILLDTLPIFPLEYQVLSEWLDDEIYLSNNNYKPGYYNPKWSRTRIYGLEQIPNMLVTQSTDIIWPGNLIQGKSVREGKLAPVPLGLSRKPCRVYLNAVSGQDMNYYRDIQTFTGSEVIQAMNDIMNEHTHGLPADITYVQRTVHNEEEMAYQLDMNENEFKSLIGDAFSNTSWKEKKNRVMVKLVQVYFQMVYEFNGMHEVFKENTNIEDLRPYVGDRNPMCYISSVSYGRYFVLLYESDQSYEKLSQAINKTFNQDVSEPLTSEDKSIMRSARVTLRQIGGDADSGLQTITGDAEKIREFVLKGAIADKDNVGAPIFYNMRYLGNSYPVKTYKTIDSEVNLMEYVPAKKKNDVVIHLDNIRSNALYLTGGNYSNISGKSKFSVSNIYVDVMNGNILAKRFTYNPQITNVGTTSLFSKNCSHEIKLGQLGENTTKKVKISFTVTYYAKRYSNGFLGTGGSSSGETKSFQVVAVYKFNPITEKWEKESTDLPGTTVRMNYMKVNGNVDHCGINFNLNYKFSANKETY